LQLGLQNPDRAVSQFLWIKNVQNAINKGKLEIHEFQFCHVFFGCGSSQFLLRAALDEHIKKASDKWKNSY
jgi:hypothetical protein